MYKTTRVEMGKCHTCGKTLTTHVAPIDFIGRDGTRHDIIQIEAHCGTPGHNTYTAKYTWLEMSQGGKL
jgi:hypothetical protein